LGKKVSYSKFVDLDTRVEKIMGIASGLEYPFPDRDDPWVIKFDKEWTEQQAEKHERMKQAKTETFADIFI
jgi:hypothetical protein